MKGESLSRLLLILVIGLGITTMPVPLAAAQASSNVEVTLTALESGCPAGKTLCFDKSEIRVKEGDTIVLTAVNPAANTGEHDVAIDEFDVHIHLHDPGDEGNATFVADRAGTFTFYCSVLGHQAAGMEGSLIVEGESSGVGTFTLAGIIAGVVVAATVVTLLVLRSRR